MRHPGGATIGVLVGGAVAVAGSLMPWATARLDLTGVFSLFPPDFRQRVLGVELGGNLTLVGGVLILAAGVLLVTVPRHARWIGVGALVAAAMTFMGALYHLIRIGPLAVDAIARASGHQPAELGEVSVTPGLGPFLVLAAALAAMVAGVLLAAGRSGGVRPRPDL